MKLCSACLLGIRCRYDGKVKANKKILRITKHEVLIPICPEQLGGLPTPRPRSEKKGGKVLNTDGFDETKKYIEGAKQVLLIAKMFKIKEAIMKAKSPSCGSGLIYDGSFTRKLVPGDGVTTKLLKKNGIRVVTEEEI
jgi:uncharacterized protein YbbK (DUF523 family)